MNETRVSSSSFRDPAGFIYEQDGVLYRQINAGHESAYLQLESSGLQLELDRAGLVVPFRSVDIRHAADSRAAIIIEPKAIPLISYPYEWSFSQLKDAGLLTLEIMRRAVAYDMSLKDASAYNVQFIGCSPIFIDTLSFEKLPEGEPWVAYKQFCQHFVAPLALMAHCDIRLGNLLRSNIDGIPLDLAAKLLPSKTKFNPGLLTHIHLHAKAQSGPTGSQPERKPNFSKTSLLALIDSLKGTLNSLTWKPTGTEWGDYYTDTNYSKESFQNKIDLVNEMLSQVKTNAKTCWDLGANDGTFSTLALRTGLRTTAWDIDPAAVEKAYLTGKANKEERLLPLLQDLSNPSSGIGWAGEERQSLSDRGPADVALALALIHHLAIGNNLPLNMVSAYLSRLCRWLIIEFVPKDDSQVQRMLVARKDIFKNYTATDFEAAFSQHFEQMAAKPIAGTKRTLYLFKNRSL
ncbi:MAG TPA: hypothetical protein VK171_16415 [Fimbriimonas sp.]|nr:hypothetical protein [Fimbriimonas sp.]